MNTKSALTTALGVGIASLALVAQASAAVTLTNLGFEDPSAGKITGFDATTDVPGWSDVTSTVNDSGVESAAAHSGSYQAFFMGRGATNDRGVYQMTGHMIALGDVITVGYWAKNIWAGSEMTVVVFADSPDVGANELGWATTDAGGSKSASLTWNTTVSALNGTWQYYELQLTADATHAGQQLGVHFANTSGGWTALDDVSLSVVSVPEPSAALLGGLGMLGLLRRRRF